MGLADLILGKTNPFSQWVGQNKNMIRGWSEGLAEAPGFTQALQRGAGAGRLDDAEAIRQQQIQQAADEKNQTVEWLNANHPDLGAMVAQGMPVGEAWGEALRRLQPAPAPDYPSSYDEFLLAQKDPAYAAHISTDAQGNVPSGYRVAQNGNLEYIPGGPADPKMKGADMTQAEQRNQQLATVIEPELQTVETNWDELTNPKNQIIGANTPLGSPGFALTSPGYQQATNALQTIIASYLYSVSGATATDAEIKRQMDILTPKFGESKESADQKKARIRVMAQAVAQAAGKGMGAAPAGGDTGGGYTILGVE